MQFIYTKILYIYVSNKQDNKKPFIHTQPTHTNLLHTRNYTKNSKPLIREWFFFAKFFVRLSFSIQIKKVIKILVCL